MNHDKLNDKIYGLFLGLGTGDLIGGPTAMNIVFAESLLRLKRYDHGDLKKSYIEWFIKDGFDTGLVTGEVLKLLSKGVDEKVAVELVHKKHSNMTGGCNPVHRTLPLAAASFISDEELVKCSIDQASLTHYSEIAGDIAAATVVLIRQLIKGQSWKEAKQIAAKGRLEETKYALLNCRRNQINSSGYAPDVLKAAIYFLDEYNSFKTALESSIEFAGGSNYCPVLVGAIGGTKWGFREIPKKLWEGNRNHSKLMEIAKKMLLSWVKISN